ncbi:MAG TPA: formate dehydrogenase accessory sulfurtransferase FdhD [Actinocrinis sp.]|nr:formate dehydrogenase accessory sulfurtransferase FdhD [Actinocrinis sp.]
MGRVTTREAVLKLGGDAGSGGRRSRDILAAEEPLEIRVAGKQIAVTMRTPGDDFDLVAGYLVGEGVIREAHQIARMRFCGDSACSGPVGLGGAWSPDRIEAAHDTYNIVDVDLAPGTAVPLWSLDRNTYTTSACGVCGKSSIEAVRANAHWSVETDPVRITPEILYSLPRTLRAGQKLFSKTGGLHAAGLFTSDGTLLCVREDVGRHNAVDKVIGWAVRDGRLPLRGHLLAVSGRASFELVQKAAAAGIPLLAAVSAPSSLAVELARESGMTLAGFVRGESANVYCGVERIASGE